MRRFIWSLFQNSFVLFFVLVAVFGVTLLMRGGIKVGEIFVARYLPIMLQKMWADKWYIVALILAALLIWSWPDPEPQPQQPRQPRQREWQSPPIRRGRHVVHVPRAAPRVYSDPSGARSISFTPGESTGSKIRRT